MAPLQRVQEIHRMRFDVLGVQRFDLQPQADRFGLLLGNVLGGAPSRGEPPGIMGRRALCAGVVGIETVRGQALFAPPNFGGVPRAGQSGEGGFRAAMATSSEQQ
jgi:hypothetical protein